MSPRHVQETRESGRQGNVGSGDSRGQSVQTIMRQVEVIQRDAGSSTAKVETPRTAEAVCVRSLRQSVVELQSSADRSCTPPWLM
eukprot:33949-Amphidinium_carterae.1